MIYVSFTQFDMSLLKGHIKILNDPNILIRHLSGRTIGITKYPQNPKFHGEILFSSYLDEFISQCGVAILSSIPYDKERFGQLLPIAEELCDFYGYNTLMLSINDSKYVENFESFGFQKIWENINIHTGHTITVFSKNLNLNIKEEVYGYDDDYDDYDEEDE